MEYDNTNKGSLFKNNKEGNEKRPDYKGSLNVGGVDYYVSSWIQTAKSSGEKYMSLKIEPKNKEVAPSYQAQAAKPVAALQQFIETDVDDDIPF